LWARAALKDAVGSTRRLTFGHHPRRFFSIPDNVTPLRGARHRVIRRKMAPAPMSGSFFPVVDLAMRSRARLKKWIPRISRVEFRLDDPLTVAFFLQQNCIM